MRFVDRIEELSSLNDSYSAKGSNLVVIYGRRRIGKTELIKRFGEDKGAKYIYYFCDSIPISEQVRRISNLVGRAIGDDELIEIGAASLEAIFYRISKFKNESKLIIALDEFQNLPRLDKNILYTLQKAWDLYIKDSANLMLILSGSSISMMRDEILNYSAPLYGRSTSIFNLKPLSFEYAMELTPKNAGIIDRLYAYFVFGGVPAYYAAIAGSITDYDNASIGEIIKQMLKEGSVFGSEPGLLLSEEVRNDTKYIQILELIANGINKPSEIASKAGIAHGNLNKYIDLLEYIGLVKKELPVTINESRKSKRGVYKIVDNFIDFYFKKLKREISGKRDPESIIIDLDLIAQARFEDMAKEFLAFLARRGVLFPMDKVGRWWGADASRKKSENQEEIDAVAYNESTKDIIFAECKWSTKPVGTDVYIDLKRKAKLVDWRNDKRKEHFALFSKSGFTDEMNELAKKECVLLFDPESIEQALKGHYASSMNDTSTKRK